jgi:hypothetical protein
MSSLTQRKGKGGGDKGGQAGEDNKKDLVKSSVWKKALMSHAGWDKVGVGPVSEALDKHCCIRVACSSISMDVHDV